MPHTIRLLLLSLLIAGSFVTGAWYNQRSRAEAAGPANAARAYVCPMHPDIRSDHPGDCPACGMALVAAAPAPTGAKAGAAESMPRAALDVDSRTASWPASG